MSFIEIDNIDLVYEGAPGSAGETGTLALKGTSLTVEQSEKYGVLLIVTASFAGVVDSPVVRRVIADFMQWNT